MQYSFFISSYFTRSIFIKIVCLSLSTLLVGNLAYGQEEAATLVKIQTFKEGLDFTCVTVDASNNVWAGTNKEGLFFLNNSVDAPANKMQVVTYPANRNLGDFKIQAIAADDIGTVWVGHNGLGGASATKGGIAEYNASDQVPVKHYGNDSHAPCLENPILRDGLATRDVISLFVDNNATVWSAHKRNSFTSGRTFITFPGSLSFKKDADEKFTSKGTYQAYKDNTEGPDLPYPAYTCNPKPDEFSLPRNCSAVGGNEEEVWVGVYTYITKRKEKTLPNHILRYDLNGTYIGKEDYSTMGIPHSGGFNSIHLSPRGDAWVSFSHRGKGFGVKKDGVWNYVPFEKLSCMMPTDVRVNTNGIWGNDYGNVFLGTEKGLLVYNGRGPIGSTSSYNFYTDIEITDSDTPISLGNVRGGASMQDTIQWVATDNALIRIELGTFKTEETDYTVCGNTSINTIEGKRASVEESDASYHAYRIETKLCDKTEDTGGNCTAEHVYGLIKDNVALTAPTPFDFPYDDLNPIILLGMSSADLKEVENNVNNWESDEPIKYARDVSPFLAQVDYSLFSLANLARIPLSPFSIPFVERVIMASRGYTRPSLMDQQNEDNQEERTVSCAQNPEQTYHLYNSPNFILRRELAKPAMDYFCNEVLESADYDPIKVFLDEDNYTITNYTMKGHFLWPGKVIRTVEEDCEGVRLITTGIGTQYCGNNAWGKSNAHGNLVAGAILFKNIDLRLKKAVKGE